MGIPPVTLPIYLFVAILCVCNAFNVYDLPLCACNVRVSFYCDYDLSVLYISPFTVCILLPCDCDISPIYSMHLYLHRSCVCLFQCQLLYPCFFFCVWVRAHTHTRRQPTHIHVVATQSHSTLSRPQVYSRAPKTSKNRWR